LIMKRKKKKQKIPAAKIKKIKISKRNIIILI